ncbi:hypothetical protein LXL04_002892 [Taraxacum kok-saghyz]
MIKHCGGPAVVRRWSGGSASVVQCADGCRWCTDGGPTVVRRWSGGGCRWWSGGSAGGPVVGAGGGPWGTRAMRRQHVFSVIGFVSEIDRQIMKLIDSKAGRKTKMPLFQKYSPLHNFSVNNLLKKKIPIMTEIPPAIISFDCTSPLIPEKTKLPLLNKLLLLDYINIKDPIWKYKKSPKKPKVSDLNCNKSETVLCNLSSKQLKKGKETKESYQPNYSLADQLHTRMRGTAISWSYCISVEQSTDKSEQASVAALAKELPKHLHYCSRFALDTHFYAHISTFESEYLEKKVEVRGGGCRRKYLFKEKLEFLNCPTPGN